MPRHKSYSVWLECDGEILKEYEVETNGITISCWVASEIGKAFCIQWRDLHDPLDISSELTFKVDGTEVEDCINIAEEGKEYTMHGIDIDEKTVKPLVFSAISLTDDKTVTSADYGRSRHDLGIISVAVQQVIATSSRPGWKPSGMPVLFDSPWNENEAKACVHRVALGPEVEFEPTDQSSCFTKPYDKDHPGPVAIFNFKYRPEAFLRAQGIIAPALPPSQDKPETSADTSIPEPRPSQDVPPHSAASNRRAPKRRVKSEEQEVDNMDQSLDSEKDDEDAELLRRLEYWQKQQAEIQKELSATMNAKNVKDTGALVKRLRYWQTQLEEAQKKQAEVVEEMKSSRKSTRKRVKQEHEAADDSGIIEISDDSN